MTLRDLRPADVETDAPYAIVDDGVPGQWPALVDPKRVIPVLWRRLDELAAVIAALAEEVHAIETVLGVNPHGAHATVAARLAAIEAHLPPVPGKGKPK